MDVNCNDIGRLLIRLITNELLNANFEEKTIDIEQAQGNEVISLFSYSHISSH
jgi:hypothetical protein